MDWLTSNWHPVLIIAGGIVTALLTGWVIVLALIHIHRGLRRLADVQLEIARVRREQTALQAGSTADQIAQLKKDLRDAEGKLKDALSVAHARERLLAAQDENLAARAKALAVAERDLQAMQRRADEERSRHLATEARAKQLAEQVAASHAEAAQAHERASQNEQAAAMMDRQMKGMEQNAAMLSSTVADLNAKRDLLVQENRHLQERLGQESAIRQAMGAK